MKKLKSLSEFEKFEINHSNKFSTYGGGKKTNDICQYTEDTCDDNCLDVRVIGTEDGKVYSDITTTVLEDCLDY